MIQRSGYFRSLTLLAVAVALFCTTSIASAQVYVRGHYRSNGTYVQPHYRSNPDGNLDNNWSTKGNVNPYTGQRGYKNIIDYHR